MSKLPADMVPAIDTFPELVEHLEKDFQTHDAGVPPELEDWAKACVPGEFFVRLIPRVNVCVWGRILEFPDAEAREAMALDTFRGLRLCHSASILCPQGESGVVHVSEIDVLITEDQYLQAKAAGWPQTPAEARDLLGFAVWEITP